MSAAPRKVDFFIVGAPKCGTTAMHEYLRQHPDIFMPRRKDTNHFATDLLPADDPWRDEGTFLSLFREMAGEKVAGDTSVFHLYSRTAAAGIHTFNPRARIVVMLRNPVDFLASYHSQLLYTENETVRDFSRALRLEDERKRGLDLPATVRFPAMLFYSEICRFSEQVERYFRTFGREAVHCILFDELKRDAAATYGALLRFLDVDASFQPSFAVLNANKQVRSGWFNRLIWRPPPAVAALRLALPRRLRSWLLALSKRMNTVYTPRPPLSAELRTDLCARFREDVERLQDVLGMDLSGWLDGGRQAAAGTAPSRGGSGAAKEELLP